MNTIDKLRIAVLVDNFHQPESGGGYSYYNTLISKIESFQFDSTIEIVFLSFYNEVLSESHQKLHLDWHQLVRSRKQLVPFRVLRKLALVLGIKNNKLLFINKKIESVLTKLIEQELKKNKIDLLYYLTPPNSVQFNFPYIVTHWDLGHKSTFAFPELSLNQGFETRDNYQKSVIQKAFAIFVESGAGKEELVFFERVNPERIFVIPLFAGEVSKMYVPIEQQIPVLENYSLEPTKFFFYPAQFWPHKNHYNLLLAFKVYNEQNKSHKLILTGSNQGTFAYIKKLIFTLDLEHSVMLADFVPLATLYTFYKNCIALVMPTFLGPTNMPLLEAKALGCKVICSDIKGHREQLQNDALYFDPSDYLDIANKMAIVGTSTTITTVFNNSDKLSSLEAMNNAFVRLVNIRKVFGQTW